MREIKFRGKRIADGDLFYGNLITEVDDDFKIEKAYIHVRLSPVDFSGDSMTSKLSLHEVDPETIMQYTGLIDKNGKEIYEGDFIKCPELYETRESTDKTYITTGYIVFEEGAWRFSDGGLIYEEYESYDGDFEVVGNFYSNPELVTT